MIDTLSRHLAALAEAQRLLRMVLANNPAFVALSQRADGSDQSPLHAAQLANDPYYRAYQNINEAIGLLGPPLKLTADRKQPVRLCDAVTPLKPQPVTRHVPAAPAPPSPTIPIDEIPRAKTTARTVPNVLPVNPAPLSRIDRLRYVLEAPGTPPPAVVFEPTSRIDRLRHALEAPSAPPAEVVLASAPSAEPYSPGAIATARDEAKVAIVWRETPVRSRARSCETAPVALINRL